MPAFFRPTKPFRSLLRPPAVLMVLALTGCQGDEEAVSAAAAGGRSGRVPEQQFFDYRLIESKLGVRQWVLESEQMQKFTGEKNVLLVAMNMDFFREGEHFSTLTADSGRADLNTRDIHTWGNVVVVTNDGRRLETEELFFNNETQLIHNDVFDRFTRDQDVVTGIGLEATPDLEYIEIKQRVEAEVEDEAPDESEQQ